MKKMNMLWTKIAAIALGAILTVGVGVSFSSTANGAEEVKAYKSGHYYLVGSFNGWSLDSESHELVSIGGTEYQWIGVLALNAEFKLNTNNDWGGAKGYSDLTGGCKSDGTLVAAGDNNNIKVATSYEFKITYNTTGSVFSAQLNWEDASKTGVNNNKMRVWLNRGVYERDGALVCLQYGTSVGDTTRIVAPTGWVENSGVGSGFFYAYFDIPVLSAGQFLRVARLSADRGKLWNVSTTHTWVVGDNSKVFYVGDDWSTLSNGIVPDTVTTPVGDFLKLVLEGYLTCSSSAANGYNAFPQMELTFFKKADKTTWKISGELSSINIWDYSGTGTSGYGSDKGTGTTVTGWAKFSRLSTEYEAHKSGAGFINPIENGRNIENVFLVIIGLITVSTLSGFYFLTRKRKTSQF